MVSSKVMEVESIVLLRRFVSKMSMGVVPGARGSQTYLAVVGFWRDLMMSQRPGGWQQRTLLITMCDLPKLVVTHWWNVLMAILDSDT